MEKKTKTCKCGKEISRRAQSCKSCARQGVSNPNWKHGNKVGYIPFKGGIKECERCNKDFFAVRSHARFCGHCRIEEQHSRVREGEERKKVTCIKCGGPTTRRSVLCMTCYAGRGRKVGHCIDCGIELRFRVSKRCRVCYKNTIPKGKDNPQWRGGRIKRVYGVDELVITQMIVLQQGLCAICGKELVPKDQHIDHDHISGEVRGVLCRTCNLGIGLLGDTLEVAERAVQYLKKMEPHTHQIVN